MLVPIIVSIFLTLGVAFYILYPGRVLDSVDVFLAWVSRSLKQTTESYCELESADSPTVLVAHDGALLSVIRYDGVAALIGNPEFRHLREGLASTLQTTMSRPGHGIQVYFHYSREKVDKLIGKIAEPARETAKRLSLSLEDLFNERESFLREYCAEEETYFVLWTRPHSLTSEQIKRSQKEKVKQIKEHKLPSFFISQNIIAAIPDLRDAHDAFVRATLNDMRALNAYAEVLPVHEAVKMMRMSADPDFTDENWSASLPGDKIIPKEVRHFKGDVSDILWPSLAKQIIPRDAENIDIRTCRIGDKIYSTVFIDLFPKEFKAFIALFRRTLPTHIPWRMSFLIESGGIETLRLKSALSGVLSFASAQNRLINDANSLLKYIALNTDDAVVRLRVAAATWADEGDIRTLRTRTSELAKAIEGWGSCEVAEISGDPFGGVASSILGISTQNLANPSVAPLSDVVYMLPITRPASPWKHGAILFRSPDGKPWPYQPGSAEQTTWIDLVYARPGSGKSVLSNALNLALCMSSGIQRLPRIAIIDIGPSSSGLISLLKEGLPPDERHLVAYHRLRMTPEYSINPFDTQLGSRFPTPQERSFLVNFVTLLATPIGADKPYDGIPDLAGMVVDELYKNLNDDANPYAYSSGVEAIVDGILEEIGFVQDQKTTWWEVTDALFMAGFPHEAMLSQRYASPLLSDAVSICRTPAIEDLYGKITAPTGESLIDSFSRMISAAVREYPIMSRVTSFDLGEARVVSLDLDEVAKSGGDTSDRQTAVMYMLARYVLARHYYLTDEVVTSFPTQYQDYHRERVAEIREDPKRIVYDEFHRTAKAQAVRDQVIVDMREGRKWKVQIALLSQSLDDFDSLMVDFGTSIYIMDAGPAQTVNKTASVFGLSETASVALRTRVHGPRAGGGTFLAQFATKKGINTQLLSLTLGPIELWALTTTSEDVLVRNQLYKRLGPAEARRVLANCFPEGTVSRELEQRLLLMKQQEEIISDEEREGVIRKLIDDILTAYQSDPDFKQLPFSEQ